LPVASVAFRPETIPAINASRISTERPALRRIAAMAPAALRHAPTTRSPRERRAKVATKEPDAQVTDALKSLVAKNGMIVMGQVDRITRSACACQLRISVYEDTDGKTYVEFVKPSTLLAQFKNDKAGMIA